MEYRGSSDTEEGKGWPGAVLVDAHASRGVCAGVEIGLGKVVGRSTWADVEAGDIFPWEAMEGRIWGMIAANRVVTPALFSLFLYRDERFRSRHMNGIEKRLVTWTPAIHA